MLWKYYNDIKNNGGGKNTIWNRTKLPQREMRSGKIPKAVQNWNVVGKKRRGQFLITPNRDIEQWVEKFLVANDVGDFWLDDSFKEGLYICVEI